MEHPHTDFLVVDFLDESFRDRQNGKDGPTSSSPTSPDFTLFEFSFEVASRTEALTHSC